MSMIDDVAAFHRKFDVPVKTVPSVPDRGRIRLRFDLVREEYDELIAAIGVTECGPEGETWWETDPERTDLPEVADAIADLIYVLIGTAHEFGVPLAEVWRRVHESNMAKDGGGMRTNGKITKPPGWQAPDVEGALRDAGWVP